MIVAGGTARRSAPYGVAVHVADLLGVLDDGSAARRARGALDGRVRHRAAAAERPERAGDAVLGPAIARLRMPFASMQEYLAFSQAHPAFAGRWTQDVEVRVRAEPSTIDVSDSPRMPERPRRRARTLCSIVLAFALPGLESGRAHRQRIRTSEPT